MPSVKRTFRWQDKPASRYWNTGIAVPVRTTRLLFYRPSAAPFCLRVLCVVLGSAFVLLGNQVLACSTCGSVPCCLPAAASVLEQARTDQRASERGARDGSWPAISNFRETG